MRRETEYVLTRSRTLPPALPVCDGDPVAGHDTDDGPGFTWGERLWIAGQRARALARRVWRRLLPR
jgi:hypothetical protein